MAVITGEKLEVRSADQPFTLTGRWRVFVANPPELDDWRGYMDLDNSDDRALALSEAGTLQGIFYADDGRLYRGWFSTSIRLDAVGHHLRLEGVGSIAPTAAVS